MKKGISIIGFADGIGTAIGVVFWFYMASVLVPEQYGNMFYFLGITGIISYFTIVGGQNAITVYAAKNLNIQGTFYFLSLVLGLIAILFIVVIFNRVDVALVLLGYIVSNLAISYLLGKKLHQTYLKYALTQKILLITLGIGFFYVFGFDFFFFPININSKGKTLKKQSGMIFAVFLLLC